VALTRRAMPRRGAQLDVMTAHGLRTADDLLAWCGAAEMPPGQAAAAHTCARRRHRRRRLEARNAALGALPDAGWAALRPARKSAAADASFAKARAKAARVRTMPAAAADVALNAARAARRRWQRRGSTASIWA
jgi:hypothetical protein